MTWVKIDDAMPENPKVAALSPAARWAMVESWCYSARNRTDGRIPASIAKRMATATGIRQLVEAGLWEREGGDYIVHDYLQYNPSRAELEARDEKRAELSEARAEAGRRGGQASAEARRQAKAQANNEATGQQAGNIPIPVPLQEDPEPPNPPERERKPWERVPVLDTAEGPGRVLFEAHQRLTSQALLGSGAQRDLERLSTQPCAGRACFAEHVLEAEAEVREWAGRERVRDPWSAFTRKLSGFLAGCALHTERRAELPYGMPNNRAPLASEVA